jgi:4-hydroxy-tetrahydrodipicolinate synthase
MMFSGSIPALVTPFVDGEFAEDIFRRFVEWQIIEGSSALVPCGTTGEAATLSFEEHFAVVAACVACAAGRVPVIAGCGSNDTRVALKNMQRAQEVGADAALMVPPYYNKPNQEGIFAHFSFLAERCDLPILLYNVPGRTVSDIGVETMARLAELPNFVGVKDATADMDRISAQRAAIGTQFCQLSGNDYLSLGFLAMGGSGTISVTANVAPQLCAQFHAACAEGRWTDALALNDRLYPLHKALFSDASPGPTKYALSRLIPGFPPQPRLPMTMPSMASRAQVDAALAALDLC